MKIKDVIKFVASTATGLGVGKTVDIILKQNLPIDMNWKTRVATFIGSAALSGYISAKCSEQVEEEIDKVSDIIEKVKNEATIVEIEDRTDIVKESE